MKYVRVYVKYVQRPWLLLRVLLWGNQCGDLCTVDCFTEPNSLIMEKQFLSVKTLMLAALILVVSGCVITINHKFEDRYYTMRGTNQPANPGPPNPIDPPDNLQKNMVESAFLGTAYDLVFTDPENLTANSVQNKRQRAPQVFVFTPDSSRFISINLLDREYNRNLPKGVSGNPLAGFHWSSDSRWTRTAREYQNSFGFSISGGGGVSDVAAFTGSVKFKTLQSSMSNNERIYLNQDGYYEGHLLSIDKKYKHELHSDFKSAIADLPTVYDPIVYRTFINNWGTHYSSEATFGAKCTYRFTFTKDQYASGFETESSFGLKAEGGAKAVKFEIGTEIDNATKQKIQEESGAQNIEFISHGGSGQKDFGAWSKDATANRVPIKVTFSPYQELLTSVYFPEMQANILQQKRANLERAITQYLNDNKITGSDDYKGFFDNSPVKFRATILQMEITKVSPTNEKDFFPVPDKSNEIYGYVGIAAFDESGNQLSNPTTLFNLDEKHFIRYEEGTNLTLVDGGVMAYWTDDFKFVTRTTVEFNVRREDLKTGYVCLLSTLFERNIHPLEGSGGTKFPETDKLTVFNRVLLTDAGRGPQSIILTNVDVDVLTFKVRLDRLK